MNMKRLLQRKLSPVLLALLIVVLHWFDELQRLVPSL